MAYGARLESVLGESPRGFESPILRQTLQQCRVCLDKLDTQPSGVSTPPLPLSVAQVPRPDAATSGVPGRPETSAA